MKTRLTSLTAALAVSLGVACFSLDARADATLAGDLDYAAPIDSNAGSGAGFGIRVGQQLHVPAVVVNPEIGFTYHGFSKAASPKAYRGIVGLRLGVGEILRPGIFGHLGLGRLSLAGTPDLSHTAFTYDAGVFIDFTALPLVNIGVHAAYNAIASDDHVDTFKWATVGAHAALVF